MFDRQTCSELVARWAAMQDAASNSPGAFADLGDDTGPELAGALHQWEPATRGDDELIDRIAGWERLRAWVDAGQLAEIAELASRRRHADEITRAEHTARAGHGEPGQLMEFLADEIALAAGCSRMAANNRLSLAEDLTAGLPAVYTALHAGSIDLTRARIITDHTASLDPEPREAVADAVLVKAPRQTPGALRAAVARAVHIVDPGGVETRHKKTLADRRVTITPRENGMSELCAFLPADGAAAIMAALHRLAGASHTPDDTPADQPGADPGGPETRTADNRRADALIDLATHYLDAYPDLHPVPPPATDPSRPAAGSADATTDASNRRRRARRGRGRPPAWAQVQVVLPANLLHGTGPEPAELLGYGPIPTSMAYRIAGEATWQRLLTDPATGQLTDVGRTRYTPPAALADFGITRDRRCRFPACRQPRIDLDHTIAYPAGPTADYNLAGLCRHHHRLKQHPAWRASHGPDARMTWTTPTGHSHQTRPPLPVEPASDITDAAAVAKRRTHPPSEDDVPPF